MISPLRSAQRAVSIGLALVLPAALVVAWNARPEPIGSRERAAPGGTPLGEVARAWIAGGALVAVANGADAGPDLLLYRGSASATAARLPEDSVLLGKLPASVPATFALPPAGSHVHVYSLAHQEVRASLATSQLEER